MIAGGGLRSEGLATPARLVLVVVLGAGLLLTVADPFSVVFFGSYALAGSLLVIRRPRNSIGWLLLLVAVGFVGTTSRSELDLQRLVAGTATTVDFLVAWFGSWAGGLTMVALLALTILFPSGSLPTGIGRRLAVAALGAASLAVVLMAGSPTFNYNPDGGATEYTIVNRLAILPDLPPFEDRVGRLFIVPVGLLAAGGAAMLVRFRLARGIERIQMRWLVAAMAAIVSALVFGLGMVGIVGEEVGGYVWIPAIVAYPSLPAAVWIAVARYRLYEIDRVVSRTLSYAVVTALLAAAFVATNLVLQGLLVDVAGGGSTLSTAVATLLVAGLFQPVRRRVQASIDRRFNRRRVDGERVTEAFAARLRDQVDLERLRAGVVDAADEAVAPTAAALWLRSAG